MGAAAEPRVVAAGSADPRKRLRRPEDPGVPVNFSISDVFTLTAAVAFGPPAGTIAVAVDSLAISTRLLRRGLSIERVLFNAAAPPVAMWVSAHIFFGFSGLAPLAQHPLGVDLVAPWLLVFAGVYFVLNTFAIAVAIALNDRVGVVAIWRAHFQNLWFTFIGGALGAEFVVFALQLGTYGLALLSLPLLLALILHFAYRNATGRVADQLKYLADVNRLHLSTIEALAHAIDAKDAVTHGHIRRVQRWATALAARVGVTADSRCVPSRRRLSCTTSASSQSPNTSSINQASCRQRNSSG